tara:strand:+ start:305 stop:532 length:228 start_codon:yes stop_codon:yes gene_type:complete
MDVLIVLLVAVVLLASMHIVNIEKTGVPQDPRTGAERYLDLIGMHYAEMGVVVANKQIDLKQIICSNDVLIVTVV